MERWQRIYQLVAHVPQLGHLTRQVTGREVVINYTRCVFRPLYCRRARCDKSFSCRFFCVAISEYTAASDASLYTVAPSP